MENSAYNYPEEEQVPEGLLVNEVLDDFAREFTSLRNTSPRQSFTDLSQTDADLALARALQQQEHAYLLLQIGNDGSDHDATGSGSFEYDFPEETNEEEELLSSHAPIELTLSHGSQQESEDSQGQGLMDGPSFDDDEAFARALQEAENREATAYMISLLGDHDLHRNDEDEIDQSQEAWQDVDPDNMTYEELIALGEAVGTQSRGLKPNAIAALPNTTFSHEDRTAEELCVICRFDYEEGDKLLTLPCKHQYHGDCIKNWLQINKTCPICSSEVKM